MNNIATYLLKAAKKMAKIKLIPPAKDTRKKCEGKERFLNRMILVNLVGNKAYR